MYIHTPICSWLAKNQKFSPEKQGLNVSVRLSEPTWREVWARCCVNPVIKLLQVAGSCLPGVMEVKITK